VNTTIYGDPAGSVYSHLEYHGFRKLTILEAIAEMRGESVDGLMVKRLNEAETLVQRGLLDAQGFIAFMNRRGRPLIPLSPAETGFESAALGCGCGAPEPHVPGGINCRRGS